MRLFYPLDRRSRLLYLLAVLAYAAMLLHGPLSEGTPQERVFTSLLSGSLCLLLICLTRRIAFSLIATAGLFALLLVSSLLKVTYLTTPLLAPDLIYFVNVDTLEVILRYPVLLIASFIGLVLLPLGLIGIWRIDRPRVLPDWPPLRRRLVLGLVAALSAFALYQALMPKGPFAAVYGKGMWAAMNDRSYLTDFFISFHSTQIEMPQLVAGAAEKQVWNEQVATGGDPRQRPDIVVVLEESTFDPTMLTVCKLPLCKRKLFQDDKRTRAHGYLQVHTGAAAPGPANSRS